MLYKISFYLKMENSDNFKYLDFPEYFVGRGEFFYNCHWTKKSCKILEM